MKAVRSQIANFLSKKAVWFVIAAWLLLVPTLYALFAMEVGAIRVRGPQHEWANYDLAVVHLLIFSFWVAPLTAFASSIMLGSGLRTTAAASVVVAWFCLVVGGTVRLALVERGPQQFLRYAGEQQFLVPWRYSPRGSDSPSRTGFYVFLCPDTLRGQYDRGCLTTRQRLAILPAEAGFEYFWEERGIWKFSKIETRPAGVRDGYQIYIGTISAQGWHREQTILYFRRTDPEGNVRCLVICDSGSCRRQTLIGHYILDYNANYLLSESTFVDWNGLEQKLAAPETTFAEWDVIDQKLAALVDTWAVP
jgi:hypothetical protein